MIYNPNVTLPTRWSYSSISTYESCPAKWWYSYALKLPTSSSAAMDRGSRLHKHCEDYLNGEFGVIPWELTKVARALDELKNKGAKAEEVWLLDKNWVQVEDHEDCWVKSIVDVHYIEGSVLQIIDFKSGREYPEHRDQLELYAVAGLKVYPGVKRAEYKALYLDTGHSSNDGAVIRDMLEYKQASWHGRAIKIWEDRSFAPTPSRDACKWCDFHHKKKGPCGVGV